VQSRKAKDAGRFQMISGPNCHS